MPKHLQYSNANLKILPLQPTSELSRITNYDPEQSWQIQINAEGEQPDSTL